MLFLERSTDRLIEKQVFRLRRLGADLWACQSGCGTFTGSWSSRSWLEDPFQHATAYFFISKLLSGASRVWGAGQAGELWHLLYLLLLIPGRQGGLVNSTINLSFISHHRVTCWKEQNSYENSMKTFAFIQKATGIYFLLISFTRVGFPISFKNFFTKSWGYAHGCQRQDWGLGVVTRFIWAPGGGTIS